MSRGAQRKRRLADGIDRTHRFLDGFDSAQAAADRTGQPPPPRLETPVGHIPEPDLDIDAGAQILHLDRIDLVGRGDDAFGDAEAKREVFEVGRARHHHGMGGAGIGKRHWRFLRHRAVCRLRAVRAPGEAGGLGERRAGHNRAAFRQDFSHRKRSAPYVAPLCPAGHLPLKGGDRTAATTALIRQDWRLAKVNMTADLPP